MGFYGNSPLDNRLEQNFDHRYNFTYGVFIFICMIALFVFLAYAIYFGIYTENQVLVDPISSIKNNFLNIQYGFFIGLFVLFILLRLIDKPFFSFRFLIFLLIIQCILAIYTSANKINMDSIYTEKEFKKLYVKKQKHFTKELNGTINGDIITFVSDDGLITKNISASKYYVELCLESYKKFSSRCNINFAIQFVLFVMNIIFLRRAKRQINLLNKRNSSDKIFFEEKKYI